MNVVNTDLETVIRNIVVVSDDFVMRNGWGALLRENTGGYYNSIVCGFSYLDQVQRDVSGNAVYIFCFSSHTGHQIEQLERVRKMSLCHPDNQYVIFSDRLPDFVFSCAFYVYRFHLLSYQDQLSTLTDMLTCIQKQGQQHYFSAIYENKLKRMRPPLRLAPREAEVMLLSGLGISITSIARQQRRSTRTISCLKRRAMEKLNMTHSRDICDFMKSESMGMMLRKNQILGRGLIKNQYSKFKRQTNEVETKFAI